MNRIREILTIGSLVLLEPFSADAQTSTDSLKATIDSLRAQVVAMRAELEQVTQKLPPDGRTTAEFVASSIAASRVAAVFTGGMTINGDVITNGRHCIWYADNPGRLGTMTHTCKAAGPQIQLYGEGAELSFASNLAGLDAQSPRPHWGRIGLAPDGGTRIGNNEVGTVFYDDQRPSGYAGFDSQSVFVFLPSVRPGETGQREIFMHRDVSGRFVEIATGSLGWQFRFTTSTGDRTFDKHWILPTVQ